MDKNKNFSKFFVILAIVTIIGVPVFASAISFKDSIVPCGWDGAHKDLLAGGEPKKDGIIDASEQCGFNDFVRMIGNLVNGTMIIISVYAAISFMYAGYAYLTSGGSQEKVSYAKGIFKKVLIGYIIILTAWLFIRMIEIAMLNNSGSINTGGSSFLGQ